MIGDAYFQLRAQIGTGLFSLARIAGEAGAPDALQGPLKAAQARLRQPYQFVALGPESSGKSTFLNTLFDREFCGAAAPAAAGKVAIFKHGAEARETLLKSNTIECQRPHIFLRDFTIIDTPGLSGSGDALAGSLAPFLPGTDLVFFVIAAAATGTTDAWLFLRSFGRETLKRTVIVVWQHGRPVPDEAASAVKRLRQAMLKHLGQACPIFVASAQDRAALEKLGRWIENEIVFSATRSADIREIEALARAALREIAGKPRAAQQALQREAEQVRQLRAELAEHEEQSQRRIAGALWRLTQSFDALRRHGERHLRTQPILADFFRRIGTWKKDFARAFETEARESLAAQVDGVLEKLGADLEEHSIEHLRALPDSLRGEEPVAGPKFPRKEIAQTLLRQEAPIESQRVLAEACVKAARILRLPVFATAGAALITLGALPFGRWAIGSGVLAVGSAIVALILALLLRRNIVLEFGRHFAANRAALLAAFEPSLRAAIDRFYAELAPPLTARAEALAAERERRAPLLARIQQLEETFSKIAADLRADAPRSEAVGEEG